MRSFRVRAAAKINWTLEVLGKRSDGYHEVRSIMQTISLADTITLLADSQVSLTVSSTSEALANEPIEHNLAYRAAELLRGESKRGVRIELEKRIPIAAGLGGGSSDAAAVLRGLRKLWELDISDEKLTSIAAELGSDVPFLLHGGTALSSGRGEQIEGLPDAPEQHVVIVWSEVVREENKTGRVYAALREELYSNGSRTEQLAERLRVGKPARDKDMFNVFENVLPEVEHEASRVFEAAAGLGRVHLCGGGPSAYFLAASEEEARAIVEGALSRGLDAAVTRTVDSHNAVAIQELA